MRTETKIRQRILSFYCPALFSFVSLICVSFTVTNVDLYGHHISYETDFLFFGCVCYDAIVCATVLRYSAMFSNGCRVAGGRVTKFNAPNPICI